MNISPLVALIILLSVFSVQTFEGLSKSNFDFSGIWKGINFVWGNVNKVTDSEGEFWFASIIPSSLIKKTEQVAHPNHISALILFFNKGKRRGKSEAKCDEIKTKARLDEEGFFNFEDISLTALSKEGFELKAVLQIGLSLFALKKRH